YRLCRSAARAGAGAGDQRGLRRPAPRRRPSRFLRRSARARLRAVLRLRAGRRHGRRTGRATDAAAKRAHRPAIGAGVRHTRRVRGGGMGAPASGSYWFGWGLEPSRLFVNGAKLADWWNGSGPVEGSIDLVAGGKYHVRWDRFDPASRPPDSALGLTWRTPGSS